MNDRSKWARYEVEMDTHHVRQIIRALYEHRILSNKSLAREVGVTTQNLSNILKRLKDAGMVFVHKTPGRKTVQYSLNPEFKIYYERNYKGKRVKTIHFLKSEFESYEQVQDRFFLFSKR